MTTKSVVYSLTSPTRWLLRHLAMAAALAGLGDWLLYRSGFPGLSLAAFLAACGLVAILANPVRAGKPLRIVVSVAFAMGLLTVVEELSWLSFFVATGATVLFALAMIFGDFDAWPRELRRSLVVPFVGGFWLVGDFIRARKLALRKRKPLWRIGSLVGWIVPVVLFLVFLSLFASANPLIDAWVRLLDPRMLLEYISIGRTMFWLLIACLVWPFVHMRRARRSALSALALPPTDATDLDTLFSGLALVRSLVLFNGLFALQTSLDLVYLWGGLALPNGLTHAAYAHRGAYPLIGTALLAAVFVLIAMRRGGPAETSRWIRPLVLVWVAQNFLLVLSSIFRTGLYVAAYSLSELRLAAMIWMGLVAAGLVLIVVQIVRKKSNKWLLNANALAAAGVVYACCFLNFPYIVASYNVAHCLEATGKGPALDVNYLGSLGPQAMPAYELYYRDYAQHATFAGPGVISERRNWARNFAKQAVAGMTWRDWSFRGWRLKRYFDTQPADANS
jgi:hypothetical protein